MKPRQVGSYRESVRAPSEHASSFIDPDLKGMASQLAENRSQMAQEMAARPMGRESLADFAQQARVDLLQQAFAYTARYRRVPAIDLTGFRGPIILSGHQPQFFHPGVWLKNFLLHAASQSAEGLGVHLVMDNDVPRTNSVRVPTQGRGRIGWTQIAFDGDAAGRPYEEQPVQVADLWETFPARIEQALSAFQWQPLVGQIWHAALAAEPAAPSGQRIARARHAYEAQWGLETLEVPFSQICDTSSFWQFALHLMHDHQRLRETYNVAVTQYRRAHRIRSRHHPVPLLNQGPLGDEVPFWIWSSQQPRRHAVFVSRRDGKLHITGVARDAAEGDSRLELALDVSGQRCGEQLREARFEQGIKLRPRALTTTMYARLVLGDYFIHGIGGAKYDQVTDQLIRRMFHISAPRYAIVSGTYRLPFARPDVTAQRRRQLLHWLRQSRYQPEACLTPEQLRVPWIVELVEEKRHWIRPQSRGVDRRRRHQELERINRRLAPLLDTARSQSERALMHNEQEAREHAILNSREYAWCLFPAAPLIPWLQRAREEPATPAHA